MKSGLLVAVDGGNSKTDLVLLRRDGAVAAAVRGPASNPHFLGTGGTLDVVEHLIGAAWRQAANGPQPDHTALSAGAFFLAGADQPDEVRALHAAISRRGWADEVLVGNDTTALLWTASPSGCGVAVVVGAGINGFGRSASGLEAHFAALGEITGDWGGGSGIGMAALGAAVRAEDGRGPATALSGLLATHFGTRTALDVALAIHRNGVAGRRLTELPPLVFDAARAGDREATTIVDRQADEVVSFAVAALRRIEATGDSVDVILGGSVMTAAPARLLDRVRAGVAAVAPRARVILCPSRPVVGAAIAALNLVGADGAARARLRAELTDERITVVSDDSDTDRR